MSKLASLLVLIGALSCFSVRADTCQENISGNNQDSFAHQINLHDTSSIDEDDLKRASAYAIVELYVQCGCPSNITRSKITCGYAIVGVRETEVCYLEESYGYFLFSRDYLGNINIIFNRWD